MTEGWRKLTGLFRRDEIDAELREEMQTHLEMKASETGDPQAARREFGNVTRLLEDSRAAWGWPQIEAWLRDVRYALRVVARKPGFAATVVLTLALGIGASSTIYSLIDAVLLRPLPYPNSERLVAIHEANPADQRGRTGVSPGRLEDWQSLNSAFDALAGSQSDTLIDMTGAEPERLSAAFVSPGFFAVLGTEPALGSGLPPGAERFGGPRAIVVSDGFWRRRFGSSTGVLGQRLVLAGESYVIAGVMPGSFQYPSPATEIWVPKQANSDLLRLREARFYSCVGRLKPFVTMERAQTDLAAVQRGLGDRYPKTDAGWTVAVEPLKDELVGKVRRALWLLFGSASLLLLIACANVACLLLARLNSRTAEIATRCSLGAGRGAIARQLLAEGLTYSLLGGALGMTAAFAGMNFLRRQLADVPRIAELAVDGRMLALVAGVSVLAAVLFSLAPIAQTFRRELSGSLRQGGRSAVGSRQRMPRLLVSAQLALATALLIGAGLFVRSLLRMEEAPLGFRPENVLILRVGANMGEAPAATIQRHQRILGALASVPGIKAVAMSSGLPGVNPTWPREFEIAGEPASGGTLRFARWRMVTSEYFQTLAIPVLAGRSCRMNSEPERAFEALVNRSFAERYFPGRDPLDRILMGGPHGGAATRVVGMVADAREDGHGVEAEPLIYACGYLRYWPDSDFLVQAGNLAAPAQASRAAARTAAPGSPVYAVRRLADALQGALSQTRFRTLLVGLFSMLALTLAAIGLYGVMAYMVAQRTREFGVRVALGARPVQIAGEILRSGAVLAGAGAAAGIAVAAASSRMLGTLLYGIGPADATSYLAATGVLLGVALLACLIPGRRATSIDPIQALREQ